MTATLERRSVQTRTLRTLGVTQVFASVGVTAAISVNALMAKNLSGSESLAGLAQTSQILGAAIATYLVARITDARGRRLGLAAGYLLGAVGAAVCVASGALHSFPLLLIGALLVGSCTAAGGQVRYAATDLALPQRRGRDLSLIVWTGTIGASVGPNLSGPGSTVARWLGLPELTGAHLLTVGSVLVGVTWMWVMLRPDPLLLAREWHVAATAARDGVATPQEEVSGPRLVRASPVLRAAAVGLALSHSTMVTVMVMTPIHMDHGQATLQVIGLVISIHVMGMFALSPVVGWAVDRVGAPRILVTGGAVLLLACVMAGVAPAGHSLLLTVALALLGVGWSFAQIAASTMVTAATTPRTRPIVQGFTDVLTLGLAAVGGVFAGLIVAWFGFAALCALAALAALGVVYAAFAARAAYRQVAQG